MGSGFKQMLLAVGAVLMIAGASTALAQPTNCGDVNNDQSITSADVAALAANAINSTCNSMACADVNADGAVNLGDQIVLSRFLGEQNLLYKLCTRESVPVACASDPMSPFTGRVTTNLTIPGPHDTPAC